MGLIDININKETQESTVDVMKIFGWIIPFLFGLLSTLIIDLCRLKAKRKKLKKFTITYLKNDLMPILDTLKESYERVDKYVEEYENEKVPIKAFENFNSSCLEIAEKTEYYTIFKDDFSTFINIKSTIVFLTQNLPSLIITNYLNELNQHLKEEDAMADINHIKACAYCQHKRDFALKTLKMRIKEVTEMKAEINDLISKYKL